MFVALIRRVEERQKDCVWSLSFGRGHYCAAQHVRFAETHSVGDSGFICNIQTAVDEVCHLKKLSQPQMTLQFWHDLNTILRWGLQARPFCFLHNGRQTSASTVLWLYNYVVKIPCSTLNFINNQGCSWNRKFVLNFDFLKPMHMKYLYPHVVARFNVFELQIVAAKSSEFHF